MRTTTLVVVGSVLLTWHGVAYPCQCRKDRSDVMTQLRSALDKADAVFLARAVAQRDRPAAGSPGDIYITSLEILEQYKGKVDQKLEMPSGTNGGDCTFRFMKGQIFLVYAYRTGETLSTGHCTRSRVIDRLDDSELTWLRTRVPLPTPVVVRRRLVTCKTCDLDAVTRELVGPESIKNHNLWFDGRESLEAFQADRPFWSKSIYDEEADFSSEEALGLSKDHRAFELVQTPYYGTEETCRQTVRLRWCKRLEPTTRKPWLPQFTCVEPSSEVAACNESDTRVAADGPMESLSAIQECDWSQPDRPQCDLSDVTKEAGEGPASPLLYCIPSFDSPPNRYACRVRTAPASTPAPR